MRDYMSHFSHFDDIVTAIYGVYLNSRAGFRLLLKEITEHQETQLQHLRRARPELASIEYLDSTPGLYCEGDSNVPGATVLYQCSLGEYKERNGDVGINSRFVGNMCIIALYQYWEDHFRSEVAKTLGTSKDEVQSDIMGDLRLLRNSIIHHGGIALKEVEKCKLLPWFREGDDIFFDDEKFKTILSHIRSFIEAMRRSSGVDSVDA